MIAYSVSAAFAVPILDTDEILDIVRLCGLGHSIAQTEDCLVLIPFAADKPAKTNFLKDIGIYSPLPLKGGDQAVKLYKGGILL